MTWLREFRLMFGGATPATAAVLAIFMGAMGAGSALFGRKAETSCHPLRLYAYIELGVGVAALLTPLLLWLVRALYLSTGGIAALGVVPATLLQLILATVVLAPPCLLMGGSLPAAFKWVETDRDAQRGSLGVLYGVNTLGALAGVLLSTFWLLELWGIRATVTAAACVNLLIGGISWYVAQGEDGKAGAAPSREEEYEEEEEEDSARALRRRFVYAAAGITGFTFFLAELVWFRILAPLLGSSVYGFGLILALALAGIGLGGLLYRVLWAARAGAVTLPSLARVAAWQALFLALPWALGDRIAVFAVDVNQLRALGMLGQITGWTLITALLVLGPSVLAGVQFPLLVGLLGRGSRDAGRHTGLAYAANTLGSIAGSLAGGFVLLPWLSAPGAWRLVFLLTLLLSVGAALLGARAASWRAWVLCALLWLGAGALMQGGTGPTAAWRHKPIGYGRVETLPGSINGLHAWLNAARMRVGHEFEGHEFEGREASVAAVASDEGWCLYVNGKSDGSAFGDADTQVMQGLVPALLHPAPRSAFVVGLGTGTTAGWVADVPDMQQVDVVELEPAMTTLVRDHFAPVNRHVLDKKNVRLIPGDAREALLAAGRSYDLVISEPSNPYRAGVSTLFTQEFYAAARARLNERGLFAQWVQGYEVDSQAIRQVYATLCSIFPHVETWVSGPNDLLFIGHTTAPDYTMNHLRARLALPLFTEALRRVWLTDSVEGVLARHLATPDFSRRLLQTHPATVNTDDRNLLEYGFARALSQEGGFDTTQVLAQSLQDGTDLPAHLVPQVDRARLAYERQRMLSADHASFSLMDELDGDDARRAHACASYAMGRHERALATWTGPATSPYEQLMLLECAAQSGTEEQFRPYHDAVKNDWPADAHLAAAVFAYRQGSADDAAAELMQGFAALRSQVWVRPPLVRAALALVPPLVADNHDLAREFLPLLQQPFPGGLEEPLRINTLLGISSPLRPAQQVEVMSLFEPHPPWRLEFLQFRLETYRTAGHARAAQAERDVAEYLKHEGRPLDEGR